MLAVGSLSHAGGVAVVALAAEEEHDGGRLLEKSAFRWRIPRGLR